MTLIKNVVLISCVKKKLSKKSMAKDLYVSSLFRLSLKYAESLKPDNIYILSAKHGLIDLDEQIDPYEQTLNKMPKNLIKVWAEEVIRQIQNKHDLDTTTFTLLAGKNYYKFLLPHMKIVNLPLQNLGLGFRLRKLKELTS